MPAKERRTGSSEIMKLLAVLAALLMQCAATKSWNNDSYSEETYSVFGWFGYLKRFSVIALMLSGVVLYYIPESRPHARRICYALIDLTANGLKSALSTRESEYMYEKIKSKYQRARYEQALAAQKRVSQNIRNVNENFGATQKCYSKRSKILIDGNDILGSKEKRKGIKLSKDLRQSRHRFRNTVIKDVSAESCMEISKPVYFYPDKLDDLPKYLKTNSSGAKRANGSAIENYTLLISGSPQQMAMFDQKYEKDDMVIVQDPYTRVEYKECGTSTDKLSSKAEASSSEQEGPTRDYTSHVTDSRMETYVKEVELSSIPEGNGSRYSVNNSLRQPSQFQCGGECCGSNGCSMSSADLSNRPAISMSPVDVKNVLKSSRSMVTPKPRKKIEESNEKLYTVDYDNHNRRDDRPMKSINSNSNRKVDFREEDLKDRAVIRAQKHEENGDQSENASRMRRKSFRNNDAVTGFHCQDVSYYPDRGGEADDENSLHGERTRRNLDEEPQRENTLIRRSSDDSIFDYDFDTEPILKNRLKPVLLRALNWIFGGCPEASRRAAVKRGEVGKEESQRFTDEWLL